MKSFNMGQYQVYAWKGVNRWGKKAKGVIVADSAVSAENETRRLGVTISYFKRRPMWMLTGAVIKKIKVIDIVLMMRQFSTLISAGIPISQAIEMMSNGVEKVKMRALLLTLRDNIAGGQTLSEAFAMYPAFFSNLICGLINAGEKSGTLDKMLIEVANYLERQEFLKNRIKKALYYPITVTCIALTIGIGLLVFVVPQFEKMYASFNAKLPTFTQKIVDLSHTIVDNWWVIIIVIMGIVFVFRQLKRKSTAFQRMLDSLALHMIIFGKLAHKAILARICSTLAITLTAGVPLIDALQSVAKVANNHWYRDAILNVREEVVQGESISLAMRSTQMFPALLCQMIEIGEKSGSLDQMLNKMGVFYSDDVNTAVEGLTTLIEPILIVILGTVVGVFLFAMYLPLFKLGSVIK